MTVGAHNFVELVKAANKGTFSLPAFQRDWKWQRKQVASLYDSIRNQYPIGTLLAIEVSSSVDFQPRPFRDSESDDASKSKKLILDGQQRLTAGIQLLIANNQDQTTHYFIDLGKLTNLFHEYCVDMNLERDQVIEDQECFDKFTDSLDEDSGYIAFKPSSKDPKSKLIQQDLLHIPLLSIGNERHLEPCLEDYYNKFPEKKEFTQAILPSMKVFDGPQVPVITIEDNLSVEAISRVFSTLNTSGKMLTPFELVVATLFPKGVNLIEEIEAGRAGKKYYENMDKSREIVLQICVLLEGKDPKKALLPKTLEAGIWKRNNAKAFNLLEEIGEFLTNEMGFALDKTSNYIPYDSLFCPLAVIWSKTKISKMPSTKKGPACNKIKKWVVGSVLMQRYQEGVHNKQKSDADTITNWINGEADEPNWLQDAHVPAIRNAEPRGAIGKLLLCLINRNNPKDPIDESSVNLGDRNCEDHHIFPNKFAPTLPKWNDKNHKSNVALNIMRTTSSTNKEFLTDDPKLQIQKSKKSLKKYGVINQVYGDQLITESMLGILEKSNKTADDFRNFIQFRQNAFTDMILEDFDISDFSGEEIEEAEAES